MDESIDRALSTYVPAEAPLGLEQRILASARAPRRSRAPWLAAAVVACTVCAVVTVRPFLQPRPPIPADMPQALLPVRATAPLIPSRPLLRRITAHRRTRRPALPKLAVFPIIEWAPEPELELARLALNPEIGKALLAQPQITEPEPIRIEPLSIKLLDED